MMPSTPPSSEPLTAPAVTLAYAANSNLSACEVGRHKHSDTLVDRLQQGDLSAFEEIMRLYEDRLRAFCYQRTGSAEDARDIVQETFLKLHNCLSRGQDFSAGLVPWLYRTAANHCLDLIRRRRLYEWLPWEHFDRHPGRTPYVDGPDADPYGHEDREETGSEVRSVMLRLAERLPAKYGQALWLKYAGELSAEEISQILERTPVSVKTMVCRARAAFRLLYQEMYGC